MQEISFVYKGERNPTSEKINSVKHKFDYEIQFEPSIDGIKATRSNKGLPDLIEAVLDLSRNKRFDIQQTNFHMIGDFSIGEYKLIHREISRIKYNQISRVMSKK